MEALPIAFCLPGKGTPPFRPAVGLFAGIMVLFTDWVGFTQRRKGKAKKAVGLWLKAVGL
jgi:hypothetical protein